LDYLTTHTSLSPIQCGFAPGFVNYIKGCTRLAAASDKVYQLLAHDQGFSPGTLASSPFKTKSGVKHQKSKSNQISLSVCLSENFAFLFPLLFCSKKCSMKV
jgi:hypothetical protein